MVTLRVRQNLLNLPLAEVQRITAAFNVLKANGQYDEFTRRHMQAMMTVVPAGSYGNAAHSNPLFLPWHRAFAWELETALIATDPAITGLPYWKWENANTLTGGKPKDSVMWTADYWGPDGTSTLGDRVTTGPFKDWKALIYNYTTKTFSVRSTAGLIRRMGRDPQGGTTTLPSEAQVADALAHTTYDVAPYNAATWSFRGKMEGFTSGPRMHNQVHRYIGGDMLAGTSPNDPTFWVHHANVDRLWWQWQNASTPRRPYLPVTGPETMLGVRANDPMQGLLTKDTTPASVQDIGDVQRLGYTYA
jgi:tyrosinase